MLDLQPTPMETASLPPEVATFGSKHACARKYWPEQRDHSAQVSAKARIVPVVINEGDGILEEASSAFFLSLARDVRAFVEPVISEKFAASLAAKRAAQS